MRYCKLFVLPAMLAVLPFVLGGSTVAEDAKEHDHHAKAFMDCAKACNDCQRECDSCSHHCAHMVAEGKKDHLTTLGTCVDCADHCSTAARIVARRGPMAANICEACAKACDVCGDACAKFTEDAHMKRCAEECRKCAKACREMLKHAPKSAASS